MRRILILIGALVGFAALMIGAADIWRGLTAGPLVLRSLGEIWYAVSPGTLNLLQAVVQRYTLPEIWDPWIVFILTQPAVLDLTAVAAIFLAIGAALHRRR